jgi:hypothetical protein
MNLVEKDFISFVDSKCRYGVNREYFKFDALSATVKRLPSGGYFASVHDEEMEVTLSSARKDFRRFASIDSAGKFLKSAGFRSFQVCMV